MKAPDLSVKIKIPKYKKAIKSGGGTRKFGLNKLRKADSKVFGGKKKKQSSLVDSVKSFGKK